MPSTDFLGIPTFAERWASGGEKPLRNVSPGRKSQLVLISCIKMSISIDSKPMKIGILTPSIYMYQQRYKDRIFAPGELVRNLVKGLLDRGHNVTWFSA